jgi:plastocyanin
MTRTQDREGRYGVDSNARWLHTPRRSVLKAVGAGGTLAALGGVAAAQEDDEGGEDDGDESSESGTVGGGDGHAAEGRVHEVSMLIGPSTDEARPADFYYQPTGLHAQVGDVLKLVATTPDHNITSYHPSFGMRRRVPLGVDPIASPILGWRPDSIPDDLVDPPAEGGGGGGHGGEGESEGGEGGNGGGESANGENGDDGNGEGGDGSALLEPVPQTWLYAFETPGVYDFLCSPHETFGMVCRVVVGDVTEAPFETSDPSALAPPRAGPVGLARAVLTDPALEPANVIERGTVAWTDLVANSASPPDEGGESGEGGGNEENGDGDEGESEA